MFAVHDRMKEHDALIEAVNALKFAARDQNAGPVRHILKVMGDQGGLCDTLARAIQREMSAESPVFGAKRSLIQRYRLGAGSSLRGFTSAPNGVRPELGQVPVNCAKTIYAPDDIQHEDPGGCGAAVSAAGWFRCS